MRQWIIRKLGGYTKKDLIDAAAERQRYVDNELRRQAKGRFIRGYITGYAALLIQELDISSKELYRANAQIGHNQDSR